MKQNFIIAIIATASSVSTFADAELSREDIKTVGLIKQQVDSINSELIMRAAPQSDGGNSGLLSYTIYNLQKPSATKAKTPQKIVVIDYPENVSQPVIIKGIPTIGVVSKIRRQEVINRLILGLASGGKKAKISRVYFRKYWSLFGVRRKIIPTGAWVATAGLWGDYTHWSKNANDSNIINYLTNLKELFTPRAAATAGALVNIRNKTEVFYNLLKGGLWGYLTADLADYFFQLSVRGYIAFLAGLADGAWWISTSFPIPRDNSPYLIVMTDKQKKEFVTNKLKSLNYYKLDAPQEPLL